MLPFAALVSFHGLSREQRIHEFRRRANYDRSTRMFHHLLFVEFICVMPHRHLKSSYRPWIASAKCHSHRNDMITTLNKNAYPRLCNLFVALFLAASIQDASAEGLRTVALSGQHAPGTATGAVFERFNNPVLNNSGKVAFRAVLQQGSGDVTDVNAQGIWSEGSGSLALVARDGSQAPGTAAGQNFADVADTTLVLNDAGQVAFDAELQLGVGGVTLANHRGIWTQRNGALELAARMGSQAPGTPVGAVFADLSRTVLNNSGQIAFRGELQSGAGGVNSDNSLGVWAERNGALQLVAREGNPVPGFPPPFYDFRGPVLNNAGRVSFKASHSNATIHVIWHDQNGVLVPVVSSGSHAPGTPPGTSFTEFVGAPAINDAGQTAFHAFLPGSLGVGGVANQGIWSFGSGSLALLSRQTLPAPGATNGERFSDFSTPVINATGKAAFRGDLYIPMGNFNLIAGEGVWSDNQGTLAPVAISGTQAPGAPSGVNFAPNMRDFVINAAGQVALSATLFPSLRGGVWAQDDNGVLQPIALPGDVIDVDEGPAVELRTIREASFVGTSGNEDGLASAFNDLGQLVFMATFTDDSRGIFVSNLVATVPEPNSIALGFVAVCLVAARSRYR
jgi:hypothetical protein